MNTEDTRQNLHWLPIAMVAWNLFDAILHVAVDMAEPLRISGNVVGIVAALAVMFGVAKSFAPQLLTIAAIATVILNVIHASDHGFAIPLLVFIGVSLYLLLCWAQRIAMEAISTDDKETDRFYHRWWAALLFSLVGVVLVIVSGASINSQNLIEQLHDGVLEGADYWSDEPLILSAGLGFDNIVGLPDLNEASVRAAEGTWYGSLTCTNGDEPDAGNRTSAVLAASMGMLYKGSVDFDDGLPIVFSWPVATETVDMSDFQFTLNTGEVVFADAAGMVPNWEHNERNVVVLFGDFGNRGMSSEDDAVFPVKLEIVADDSPLLLIGPNGQEFNAVGLTWTTDRSPYDAGPVLVGAKLNAIGETSSGEGGIRLLERTLGFPNDETALYDEGDFRIRVLTTGGFSPDGITGVRPDMYEDFFRVHVNGADGDTVLLEEVGKEYSVAGGSLRIVGLAELGSKENPEAGVYYDDCYVEDRDNYIDIIVVGDEAAARNISFVEIPALEGGYRAFYNPGGPGPEPFEGVRYTAPGPPDLEPVIIALDNPMRVDREAP